MMNKKPSLLDRLTGSAGDPYDDLFEDDADHMQSPQAAPQPQTRVQPQQQTPAPAANWEDEGMEDDGELGIDLYQTADSVVIKALVGGVQPSNLDISLTRDMVTISGTREEEKEVEEDDYFQRELYWGSFSRTILLPEEVDVDAAEAVEKHGILVIRLPKINKKKAMKLKVRAR